LINIERILPFPLLEKKYIWKVWNTVFEAQDIDNTERLTTYSNESNKTNVPNVRNFLLNRKEGLTYIEIAEFQKRFG